MLKKLLQFEEITNEINKLTPLVESISEKIKSLLAGQTPRIGLLSKDKNNNIKKALASIYAYVKNTPEGTVLDMINKYGKIDLTYIKIDKQQFIHFGYRDPYDHSVYDKGLFDMAFFKGTHDDDEKVHFLLPFDHYVMNLEELIHNFYDSPKKQESIIDMLGILYKVANVKKNVKFLESFEEFKKCKPLIDQLYSVYRHASDQIQTMELITKIENNN
jgi:hypothetical protein